MSAGWWGSAEGMNCLYDSWLPEALPGVFCPDGKDEIWPAMSAALSPPSPSSPSKPYKQPIVFPISRPILKFPSLQPTVFILPTSDGLFFANISQLPLSCSITQLTLFQHPILLFLTTSYSFFSFNITYPSHT